MRITSWMKMSLADFQINYLHLENNAKVASFAIIKIVIKKMPGRHFDVPGIFGLHQPVPEPFNGVF